MANPEEPTESFPGRKFHLSGLEGPKIGLFLPKSHDVFEASGCPAHHPAINQALEAGWWFHEKLLSYVGIVINH